MERPARSIQPTVLRKLIILRRQLAAARTIVRAIDVNEGF